MKINAWAFGGWGCSIIFCHFLRSKPRFIAVKLNSGSDGVFSRLVFLVDVFLPCSSCSSTCFPFFAGDGRCNAGVGRSVLLCSINRANGSTHTDQEIKKDKCFDGNYSSYIMLPLVYFSEGSFSLRLVSSHCLFAIQKPKSGNTQIPRSQIYPIQNPTSIKAKARIQTHLVYIPKTFRVSMFGQGRHREYPEIDKEHKKQHQTHAKCHKHAKFGAK